MFDCWDPVVVAALPPAPRVVTVLVGTAIFRPLKITAFLLFCVKTAGREAIRKRVVAVSARI